MEMFVYLHLRIKKKHIVNANFDKVNSRETIAIVETAIFSHSSYVLKQHIIFLFLYFTRFRLNKKLKSNINFHVLSMDRNHGNIRQTFRKKSWYKYANFA